MLVCPVCSTQNDEFSITCVSCHSYIQDRVPTLDFFATVWSIIETPSIAFKKIIIAEHKNYVLFLGTFLGIASIFTLFWLTKSGNNFDNLFPLLLFGIFFGIITAIPLFFSLAAGLHLLAKLFGGKGKFKETYGIVGWSLVPIAISVILILPLELATLGLYFFSSNPTAFELKPTVTSVLIGLDAALVLWTIILLTVGLSKVHRMKAAIALFVTAGGGSGIAYVSYLIFTTFNI